MTKKCPDFKSKLRQALTNGTNTTIDGLSGGRDKSLQVSKGTIIDAEFTSNESALPSNAINGREETTCGRSSSYGQNINNVSKAEAEIQDKIDKTPATGIVPSPINFSSPEKNFAEQLKEMKFCNQAYKEGKAFVKNQNEITFEKNVDQMRQELALKTIMPLGLEEMRTLESEVYSLLPPGLHETVLAIHNRIGYDKFAILLGLDNGISAALCGRYMVQAKTFAGDWCEALQNYQVIGSESGTKKSQVIKEIFAPHENFNADLQNEYLNANPALKKQNEFANRTYNKIDKILRQDILIKYDIPTLDADGWEELNTEINEVALKASNLDRGRNEKPTGMPCIITDNCSPSFLDKKMKENGEHLAIIGAEAGILAKLIKDKNYDRSLLLNAYSMESYYTGNANKEVILNRPCLNIFYMVQLEIIKNLMENQVLAEIGVTPRFGFYFPQSSPKQMEMTPLNDLDIMHNYAKKIRCMLNRNYTRCRDREIQTLYLTDEATEYIKQVEAWSTQALDSGRYSSIPAFMRKIHGRVLKGAGRLHTWRHENPANVHIGIEDIACAAKMSLVVLEHTSYTFRPDGLPAYLTALKISKYVRSQRCHEFTANEFNRDTRGVTIEKIMHGLDYLVRHNVLGYVRGPNKTIRCIMHPRFDFNSALVQK